MIKVVFYLKSLGMGGTEKSAQLFAKALNRDLFEIKFIYNSVGCLDRLKCLQKILSPDELIPCEDDGSLSRLIALFKPDIFQVFKSGFPDGFPGPEDVSPAKYCIYNIFGFVDPNPLIAKDIFMSPWLYNNNFARTILPRFAWINGPVDKPHSEFNLRKLLKLSDDCIILGRTGRPDNGIYDAIAVNAMAALKDKYKFIYLVLAPPENMVKDLYEKQIPYVALTPTLSDRAISRFYNTVDIYAHSRLDGETYGMNIAEAMIHGKPVITHWSRPNNPSVYPFQAQTNIVEHGQTGFVADGVDQYTTYLETLLANPDLCHQMGEAGKDKALREFETSVSTRKLESIYDKLQ